MKAGSQVWIAKPSLTNQASNICIFDRVSTLRSALEASPDLREWVLQRSVRLYPRAKRITLPSYLSYARAEGCSYRVYILTLM